MTTKDLIMLREALDVIRVQNVVIGSIAIHSPWTPQSEAIFEILKITPDVLTEPVWDITTGPLDRQYELMVFCNVFHYMKNPEAAFKNVLTSCRYALIQDIIIRDRGVNAILGDDGDSMRYCIPPILSNLSGSFDLTPLKDRMVFFMPYTDDGKNTHFITMIKGT